MTTSSATPAVPWVAFGAYFFLASGIYLLFEGAAKALGELGPRMAVAGKTLEVATKLSSGAWFVYWAWTWLDDPTSHGNGGPGTFFLLQVICIVGTSGVFGLSSVALKIAVNLWSALHYPMWSVKSTSWIAWSEGVDQEPLDENKGNRH